MASDPIAMVSNLLAMASNLLANTLHVSFPLLTSLIWTLLGAPGLTTRNKKLLGAPGIATGSKDATMKPHHIIPEASTWTATPLTAVRRAAGHRRMPTARAVARYAALSDTQ